MDERELRNELNQSRNQAKKVGSERGGIPNIDEAQKELELAEEKLYEAADKGAKPVRI